MSNLYLPDAEQPWETEMASYGRPSRISSALDIMLEGPIGAAAFNNEFGRPNLAGYFRTYEQRVGEGDEAMVRGYHKPIMVAGGVGNINDNQSFKSETFPAGVITSYSIHYTKLYECVSGHATHRKGFRLFVLSFKNQFANLR